ncbi:MAG: hypothetical protein R3F60_13835 [bacterium]
MLIFLAFDPTAALQHLQSGQDASALLASVEDLPRADVEAARAAGLPAAIARLVADEAAPTAARLLGARALARLGTEAAAALAPLAAADADLPERAALAREAAQALAQLGRADLLGPALASADPEVRRHAAASGADPARLCALLADPWPLVRVAAAQGLGRTPAAAGCLADGLGDADVRVKVAAARAATVARLPALRGPLRRLAGDAAAPVDARAEAFVALAAQGDREPAERALAAHLASGDIEPLALAAVRALAVAGRPEDRPRLEGALRSTSAAVRLATIRALAPDPAAHPALAAHRASADGPRAGRHRRRPGARRRRARHRRSRRARSRVVLRFAGHPHRWRSRAATAQIPMNLVGFQLFRWRHCSARAPCRIFYP